MRIQLWSYNYAPEPTGIGPVSTVLAEGLVGLGHELEVVAAHPHYPDPVWGKRVLPYRETRNGIRVLRLPLWIGRATAAQRYRQELTFLAAQTAAIPALGRPDVVVSTSPSFPALLPAIVNKRFRRVPWVLWLHDILPDGAAATGIVDEGSPVIRAARRLERAAYRAADRIVVLSTAFTENLRSKGVDEGKIELIYDPATREPGTAGDGPKAQASPRLLSMGNIGYSQGLAPLVAAFERSSEIVETGAKLIITGTGVAADEVRAEVRSDRVEMLGVVDGDRLEEELQTATLGVVTQQYQGGEFNIPSKLMNFMAYRLPVLAAVNPGGEVARIVADSGAGWVCDSSDPDRFPRAVVEAIADQEGLARRADAARLYAERHFTRDQFLERFDRLLREVATAR